MSRLLLTWRVGQFLCFVTLYIPQALVAAIPYAPVVSDESLQKDLEALAEFARTVDEQAQEDGYEQAMSTYAGSFYPLYQELVSDKRVQRDEAKKVSDFLFELKFRLSLDLPPTAVSMAFAQVFYRACSESIDEQYNDAIADYTKAIALKPSYADAYYRRGITYDRMNLRENAVIDYTQAIRLQPDFATAHLSRGMAYCQLLKYEEAIADCTDAIRQRPPGGVYFDIDVNAFLFAAYKTRALAYESLGQKEKARQDRVEAQKFQK